MQRDLCLLFDPFLKSDFLSLIIASRLILDIYPDKIISFTFQTKNHAARVCLRSVTVDFHYHQNYTCPIPDAHEKTLIDCMLGEHMLFRRQDSVELCWSFLTSILNECETCADRGEIILFYDSETWVQKSVKDRKKEGVF